MDHTYIAALETIGGIPLTDAVTKQNIHGCSASSFGIHQFAAANYLSGAEPGESARPYEELSVA